MVNTGAITILASSLVLSELYSDAWETTLSTVVQYEINWLVHCQKSWTFRARD